MVALNDKINNVLIKMAFKYETFNHDFSLKLLSIEYLQSNLQRYINGITYHLPETKPQ